MNFNLKIRYTSTSVILISKVGVVLPYNLNYISYVKLTVGCSFLLNTSSKTLVSKGTSTTLTDNGTWHKIALA